MLSEVWRQHGSKRELYFGGRIEPQRAQGPEGWVHLMDQEMCIAAALADFADRRGESRIDVSATGRLTMSRRLSTSVADKNHRITFWQHLVPMPMHIGAATSPQSMLALLKVMQQRVSSK